MKIKFNLEAIEPMLHWLLARKNERCKDEEKLREILQMPDYQVEFERYGLPGLPVCGISFEEAVDFFMHFDEKDFENPRLQHKKTSFLDFYDSIEERMDKIEMLIHLQDKDYQVIESLLKNGLPEASLRQVPELSIILIVSIGNSMGWPYENYIDYDIANLHVFETKEDFLHVTAHEIHHMFVGELLAPEGIKGEEFFLQSFAYEGLAVHYNNNQATLGKAKKYDGPTYMMQEADMQFYEQHFDVIFKMIQKDYEASKGKSLEEVEELVGAHYEQFEFMGRPIQQYPTYYFGCYMWGLIDLHYGKEKLYEAIADSSLFVELYNRVVEEKYQLK